MHANSCSLESQTLTVPRLFLVLSFTLLYIDLSPLLDSDLLSESNVLPGSYKDSSDLEWQVFVKLFTSTYHWIAFYIILSICLTGKLKQKVQIVFSIAFIINELSSGVLLTLIVLSFCIVWCTLIFKSKLLQCGICLVCLLILHSETLVSRKVEFFRFDDEKILLFDVCTTWLLAKLISFSLDHIDGTPFNLLSLVSYLLYFPTLFTGPIHLYHLFESKSSTLREIVSRVIRLLRILLYAVILELMMHLIYVNAIQYHHELLTHVDGWSFFGLGYIVTVVFYLKYLVLFGFAHELSAIDGVTVAAPPTCVSIVCRSLVLWKTFDRGLHAWLLHYFYIPLSRHSKVLATATCFACVALWHSLERNIVIWCTINFISVMIERSLDMSGINFHLNCVISSPLFATMVISNICFLTNELLATLFVKRLLILPIPLIPVLIVMYAGVRVSFHRLNYKSHKV